MSENKINNNQKIERQNFLELIAVLHGDPVPEIDTFVVYMKDLTGIMHMMLVGCKPNFTEQITKSFQRMTIIKLPEEKHEETGLAETPSDLRTPEDGEVAPI